MSDLVGKKNKYRFSHGAAHMFHSIFLKLGLMNMSVESSYLVEYEPRCEKTSLLGF